MQRRISMVLLSVMVLVGFSGRQASADEVTDWTQIMLTANHMAAANPPYVGSTPVWWQTASLLADGRVLITGYAGSELFDPKSGTFSGTGPFDIADDVNTATLLMDGRVLFVGDVENDGSPGNATVYDPAAGTFTSIGTTIAPHEYATAVRLTNGKVLITGGQVPGGDGSFGSDLYLPASGAFGSAGSMTTGRHHHTATPLNDGTVLIVGGYSRWPSPTNSAEIYKPGP